MSPIVFAYVVTFTLLLAAGAAAIEHGTRGRGGARHFWTAAIVLAVLAPSGTLVRHAVTDPVTTVRAKAVSGPEELATIVVNSGRNTALSGSWFIPRAALLRMLLPSRHAMREILAQLNASFATVAIVTWTMLSFLLVAWLAFGAVHWRRAQRTWNRTILDGVSVDVSPVTGPAVVGLLSHRIVLPVWATTMEPEHRRLVLAHESEHINARDPERLVLAIAALVLMPWNLGLWWCAARLRRAIELDCDTRVLRRYSSAKEYGYVLLEVASRGRNSGPLAVPMVALLRLPSELELRLRAMTARRAAGTRGLVVSGTAAIIAIAAAFTAPVPRLVMHGVRSTIVDPHVAAGKMQTALPVASLDTGSSRSARILADQKVVNDSLRSVERSLIAKLQYMPANSAWLDSTRIFLAGLRLSPSLRRRALQFAEGLGPGRTNAIYFEFQVEKPAHALPGSIAPIYPDSLRRAKVSGEVRTEFVVDTAGRVDSTTVKIESATNQAFAIAVRAALPKIRFAPAEIGGIRVRQLVQQPFTFTVSTNRQ